MLTVMISVFIILHGVVHLLYAGHARKFYELEDGLTWPDGAWAFGFLKPKVVRNIATFGTVMVGIGFVAAGVGGLFGQDWQSELTVVFSVISSILYLCLWDKTLSKLPAQGFVGIVINLGLILLIYLF